MNCSYCDKRVYKKPKDYMNEAATCSYCGGIVCVRHARSYVDGSNEAITKNSPTYCTGCFYILHDKYGDVKKEPTMKTWDQVLIEPSLNRLATKINRKFPYMSEQDVLEIINDSAKAFRILRSKETNL